MTKQAECNYLISYMLPNASLRIPFVISVIMLAAVTCLAQEVKLPPADEEVYSFGVTVVSSSGLKGDIYLLKENTLSLPNFTKLTPIGSIYTPALHVPTRNFREGFPGITDRFEWFAIDYNGRFWTSKTGAYHFALMSDDGSKLYIDSKTIINNDGVHAPTTVTGSITLAEGQHTIRVSYFQGPREQISLTLAVCEPGDDHWRVFNTDKYSPPADTFKDGFNLKQK